MIRFAPPEFEAELKKATCIWLEFFNEPCSRMEELSDGFIDLTDPDLDIDSYDGEIITPRSTFELSLPGDDGSRDMSYAQFCEIACELDSLQIFEVKKGGVNILSRDNAEEGICGCITKNRWLFAVEAVHYDSHTALHSLLPETQDGHEKELLRKLISLNKKIADINKKLREFRVSAVDQISSENVGDLIYSQHDTIRRQEEIFDHFLKRNLSYCPIKTELNGKFATCYLTHDFTVLNIAYSALGYYSEWQDIEHGDNWTVNILTHDNNFTAEEMSGIFNAYLFELNSSLNIDLISSARLYYLDEDISFEDTSFVPDTRLRPLLIGKGLPELVQLYNQAIATTDSEFQILYYTKIIEYVSSTVIRQQATESIRAKLLSPRALNPDATFIMELEGIMEENRNFKKDREAIRQTSIVCCVATDLAHLAPNFLTNLKRVSHSSKKKEQDEALAQFANSLYSTRNSIAHSKANYTPTGDECPKTELAQLVCCARLAAQQAMRWYYAQPEELRVI